MSARIAQHVPPTYYSLASALGLTTWPRQVLFRLRESLTRNVFNLPDDPFDKKLAKHDKFHAGRMRVKDLEFSIERLKANWRRARMSLIPSYYLKQLRVLGSVRPTAAHAQSAPWPCSHTRMLLNALGPRRSGSTRRFRSRRFWSGRTSRCTVRSGATRRWPSWSPPWSR